MSGFTLRGVTVLDRGGGFTGPVDVRVVDGLIAELDVGLSLDTGLRDVDLAGLWLLPGVFDVHLHALTHSHDPWELLSTPLSYRVAETLDALRRTLHAGVTFVRDAGGLDGGVRDAIAAGLAEAPRAQVSVVPLSQTGGHGDGFLPGPGSEMSTDYMLPDYPGRPPHLADGPDEVRRVVRQVLRAGADWIKILATGGVMSSSDGEFEAQFTDEELTVAVAEATRRGRGVMVHALGGPSIGAAVRAGARSIEHGVWLTEADAALMAERGATLVPTLAIYRHLADQAEAGELSVVVAARARAVGERLGEAVRIARAAGVPVALGSDFAHRDLHGRNLREIPLLHRAGLSAAEALLAATVNGARLCGVDGETGVLSVGRRFDAVILDRDPSDLDVFFDPATVTGVFAAGRAVRPHPRWPLPQ